MLNGCFDIYDKEKFTYFEFFFCDFKFQTHFFQKCVNVGKGTFVYQ